MKRAHLEAPGVHPWDLVVDEGATRVLAALPGVRDDALRARLRALALAAMMGATGRQRAHALRRLSRLLMRRAAKHASDARLLAMLSSGEPPDHPPGVSVH